MPPDRTRFKAALIIVLALIGCDSDGMDGESCSVTQQADGVSIACGDGSEVTIPNPEPGEPCSVAQTEGGVTFTCPDGTTAELPSGGSESCTVSEQADGSVTISCPDGSTAVIPAPGSGGDAGAGMLARLVGATTTACGACHDTSDDRSHFAAMTTLVEGQPVESCATCHKESGIEPVSGVHARPALGPPGFEVQITTASIDPSTRKVIVELHIQDASDHPLTRTGVSINFVIGRSEPVVPVGGTTPVAGPYVSYIQRTVTQLDNDDFPLEGEPRVVQQPTGESNGTYEDLGDGDFRYTSSTVLPADFPEDVTHVVSLYSTRTVGGVSWYANDSYSFVPDETSEPLRRQAVHTETCNGCHNPLSAHGGSRQEVQLCLGCHSEGAVDPESNNSLDFNVMVHRIHMGADLPSVQAGVKYAIVGRNNATYDFSHIQYPRDIVHCQSCHTDEDDDRWVENGQPQACMSCHDNIYEAGVHPFALAEGATCGNGACHGPAGSAPDAREAHRTFLNTDSAPIFDISIVSASVASADAAPALTVRALTGTRSGGATVPVTSADSFSILNVFLNGPNSDYVSHGGNLKQYGKDTLVDLAATATAGEFTFSLPETLREAAGDRADATTDSFTLAIRAAYDPTPGASPDNDRVDMRENPTIAISAAGTAVARKAVVDTDKCNTCHGDLQRHGSSILARSVEMCIMCHTSTFETSARQAANQVPGPTETLRFSKLIHRIHAGHMATQPYVVWGYAPAAPYPEADFSSLAFPGDLKDCSACHLEGTYFVPIQASPSPTQTFVLDAAGQPVSP